MISADFHGWTAKTANIETAIQQIPYSTFTSVGRYDSKTKSLFVLIVPSEAVLWIKDVEMVGFIG